MLCIRLLTFFGVFLSAIPQATGQAFVDRIDPPFWWINMPDESLQIVVHGDGIAALDVAIDHPGITLQKLVAGDSPNYRFVYLSVGQDAKPGTLE